MYRQSPGRNHRSKGIKVKNVLQICLLVAVCFWLIYQVKHSHDKKKEFDESDVKALLDRASSDEIIRLGRKDIQPRVEETITKNGNHDEPSDEEETNGEEVEENKREEDEPEDKKVEEKDDDGMEGGDDETDEHEQEKLDAEVDREQEVDGEERADGDENETQETDSEDGHGEIEKESTAEDTDHDGEDKSTHEAREELYKADDASSAVTHDTQIVTTENSNEHPENISELENKKSNSEETYNSEHRKELEVEGGEGSRDGHPSNVTTSETKVDLLDNSENGSSPNNTVVEGSNDHLTSNSTTEVTIENHDLPSENVTESEPESGHGQRNHTEGVSAEGSDLRTIDSERGNNSILNVDSTRLDSNSTGSAETKDAESHSEEFPDSSHNSTVSSASEDVLMSEASTEAGNKTESSSEKNNEVEGEKLDTGDGTEESLETTLIDNPEEVQQDAIDESDTSHSMEKDVRTDLETLPEIQTEGSNNEDAAAE